MIFRSLVKYKITNNIQNSKKEKKFSELTDENKNKIIDIKNKIEKLTRKKITIKKTDTLSKIYNKLFNKNWSKVSPFKNINNKYIKLLKDINYIKKYMKYKMKYNILLKK